MGKAILELKGIKKSFSKTNVLNGINLEVKEGEFVTLLGSSGCGKTTLLRIISGLEYPDEGQVMLEGKDVTGLPPEKRNVNTVFQSYALFPHMNVEKNTGYALRVKGLPKEEIRAAVADALSKVRLDGFQKRMPSELSGGQSQRVAIARAIIGRPKILLLDEPLGALDLQLRRAMQAELKSLQKTLGITFIYITHDQEEALNMSDRVAVMRNGLFEQIGAVSDIYDFPKTAYVANFVGNANVLTGKIYSVEGDKITVSYPGGYFTALKRENENIKEGEEISASVRSEYVNIVPYYENHPKESVIATVRNKSFAGGLLHITAVLPDSKEVTASRSGINSSLEIGETAAVFWDYKRAFTVKGRLYESF